MPHQHPSPTPTAHTREGNTSLRTGRTFVVSASSPSFLPAALYTRDKANIYFDVLLRRNRDELAHKRVNKRVIVLSRATAPTTPLFTFPRKLYIRRQHTAIRTYTRHIIVPRVVI